VGGNDPYTPHFTLPTNSPPTHSHAPSCHTAARAGRRSGYRAVARKVAAWPLLVGGLGQARLPKLDGMARRGGTSSAAARGGSLGSAGAVAGSVVCTEEKLRLDGGRTQAVAKALRMMWLRRGQRGAITGLRPATRSPWWWLDDRR
jgi:hypothetical protein